MTDKEINDAIIITIIILVALFADNILNFF
jgi:hypothetical protein